MKVLGMTPTDKVLAAPPVALAASYPLGLTLPEWASVVAIVYTLLLIARLIVREWRAWVLFKERHRLPPDTEIES